jgi:hypothetical protein
MSKARILDAKNNPPAPKNLLVIRLDNIGGIAANRDITYGYEKKAKLHFFIRPKNTEPEEVLENHQDLANFIREEFTAKNRKLDGIVIMYAPPKGVPDQTNATADTVLPFIRRIRTSSNRENTDSAKISEETMEASVPVVVLTSQRLGNRIKESLQVADNIDIANNVLVGIEGFLTPPKVLEFVQGAMRGRGESQ